MKEIRQIIAAFQQIDFTKNRAAVALVARVEGSSYRRAGARMLVLDNGTFLGGISGGCLEGDALRRAQKAIAAGRPSVVTYDTSRDDDHEIGIGLGCNGLIDVLFTPIEPSDGQNAIAFLEKISRTREPRLLATITDGLLESLGKTLLFETENDWRRDFPIKNATEITLAAAQNALKNRRTQTQMWPEAPASGGFLTRSFGSLRVCFEIVIPATRLVLFGSNNDVYPLARIGHELGWEITVVANPLKMERSLFAISEKIISPKSDEKPVLDAFTAVVLMAHDYRTDFQNLKEILPTVAPYIALLGPRKRAQKMFDALETNGSPVLKTTMRRILAPAGLDIGATSPEEIALSIVAEIRAHFAGKTGGSLREKRGSIHD